jgi:hypothetical protein
MNYLTELIGNNRFSVISDLNMNLFQIFLMLILPLAVLSFLHYGRAIALSLSGVLAGLFLFSAIKSYTSSSCPQSLIVWNVRNASVVTLAAGGKWTAISGIAAGELYPDFGYASENYRIRHYLGTPHIVTPTDSLVDETELPEFYRLPGKGNRYHYWNESGLIFLYDFNYFRKLTARRPLKADKIILCGKELPRIEELMQFFNFSELVISSSVPPWLNPSQSEPLAGIRIHDVRAQGAYMWEVLEKK